MKVLYIESCLNCPFLRFDMTIQRANCMKYQSAYYDLPNDGPPSWCPLQDKEEGIANKINSDCIPIPLNIITNTRISAGAKLAYSVLNALIDSNGMVKIKIVEIAIRLRVSKRQTMKYLGELKDDGLITWRRTRDASVYKLSGA